MVRLCAIIRAERTSSCSRAPTWPRSRRPAPGRFSRLPETGGERAAGPAVPDRNRLLRHWRRDRACSRPRRDALVRSPIKWVSYSENAHGAVLRGHPHHAGPSACRAELESDAPLAVFASLQVLLPTDPGHGEREPLDEKVIAISEGAGVRTALVRFTGIGWEARERIDAFAAGHIGGPSSAPGSRRSIFDRDHTVSLTDLKAAADKLAAQTRAQSARIRGAGGDRPGITMQIQRHERWALLAIALAYYAGANIGFILRFPPLTPSVLWPPNSILTAALLLTPVRRWWLYLLAALPAHLLAEAQAGLPMPLVLSLFATNCSEALLAAACVRRWSDEPTRLDTLRRVFVFVAGAGVFAPFASSFLDAGVVTAFQGEPYWLVWRTRFFSNVLTELTVAPAIVVAATSAWPWVRHASTRRKLEAALLAIGLVTVSVVIVRGPRGQFRPAPGIAPRAGRPLPAAHPLGGGALRPGRDHVFHARDDAAPDLGGHAWPRTVRGAPAVGERARAAALSERLRRAAHVPGRAHRGAPPGAAGARGAAAIRRARGPAVPRLRASAERPDGRGVRRLARACRAVPLAGSRPAASHLAGAGAASASPIPGTRAAPTRRRGSTSVRRSRGSWRA